MNAKKSVIAIASVAALVVLFGACGPNLNKPKKKNDDASTKKPEDEGEDLKAMAGVLDGTWTESLLECGPSATKIPRKLSFTLKNGVGSGSMTMGKCTAEFDISATYPEEGKVILSQSAATSSKGCTDDEKKLLANAESNTQSYTVSVGDKETTAVLIGSHASCDPSKITIKKKNAAASTTDTNTSAKTGTETSTAAKTATDTNTATAK